MVNLPDEGVTPGTREIVNTSTAWTRQGVSGQINKLVALMRPEGL